MATPRTTIPALPEQTVPTDTDLLVVQNGPTTKHMTVGRLTTHNTQALTDHINNPSGAHPASAISALPAGPPFTGADVQTQLSQGADAINQLSAAITTNTTNLTNHIADPTDAHDASAVSVIPIAPLVVGNNAQVALEELSTAIAAIDASASSTDTALFNHINDNDDAHDAVAVSVVPTGNLVSTNVQTALVALQGAIDNLTTTLQADIAGRWIRWAGTQSDYEAVPVKDPNTLYVIVD